MQALDHAPVFGKNVIETLSEGMYDNPLFLFREYVQNAADAIDAAIEQGILQPAEAQINVNINRDKREISFEDNGTGIQEEKVQSVLANIGDSQKDRIKNKGFRGIGRLGGLGYCKTVRFETSAIQEETETILEWDAGELHKILADKNVRIDAGEVIRRITKVSTKTTEKHSHFFRVRLIGVNDTSDELLDSDEVRKYLSMVAPVPFDYERFRFVDTITKFIDDNNLPRLHEYNLFLNGDEVRKGYETPLKIEDNQDIDILNVECRLLKYNDKIIGWYWFCVSRFEGVIPKKCWQRSIRLRKANIQIGEADCLSNHPKRGDQALWREDRGNNYFLGEVHVIDSELIPNSRRDYFNQNSACRRFELVLSLEFRTLHELYHQASTIRSATEHIILAQNARQQFEEKSKSGLFLGAGEQKNALQKVEHMEKKADDAKKKLVNIQKKINIDDPENASAQVLKVYKRELDNSFPIETSPQSGAEESNALPSPAVKDKYAKVSKRVKRVLQEVFSVIDKMLPEDMAVPLKEAIIKRISHS